MQLPKSPTLGLLLLTVFISDPDDRIETTFIKLTTNQLGGTANYTGGQKDKLDKRPENKDDMQNTAHRQEKSTAEILNGKLLAKEKLHRKERSWVQFTNCYELMVSHCKKTQTQDWDTWMLVQPMFSIRKASSGVA